METTRMVVTYDDYLKLPNDGNRYEILEGELVMTPAPETDHQRISRNLEFVLHSYATKHSLGEVFDAPMDVVFSMTTVVQPDIVFVSAERSHIITKKNIIAAPDLVIEILSESSETTDRTTKKKLYEQHGVKEYWIVDPISQTVEQYVLSGTTYRLIAKAARTDSLTVHSMQGLSVELRKVFIS
jgi:Uma2 family endonuclease